MIYCLNIFHLCNWDRLLMTNLQSRHSHLTISAHIRESQTVSPDFKYQEIRLRIHDQNSKLLKSLGKIDGRILIEVVSNKKRKIISNMIRSKKRRFFLRRFQSDLILHYSWEQFWFYTSVFILFKSLIGIEILDF
jgi:hypothetical protein